MKILCYICDTCLIISGIADSTNSAILNVSVLELFPDKLTPAFAVYNFCFCMGETVGFGVSYLDTNGSFLVYFTFDISMLLVGLITCNILFEKYYIFPVLHSPTLRQLGNAKSLEERRNSVDIQSRSRVVNLNYSAHQGTAQDATLAETVVGSLSKGIARTG